MKKPQPTADEIGRRDAAELVGVTPQTIDNWQRRGIIKGIKLWERGHLRYSRAALLHMRKGT